MTRWSGYTATFNALDADYTQAVLFLELELDAGTERFHTRYGTITWGGDPWYGIGALGAVQTHTETLDLKPDPVRYLLHGIQADVEAMIDGTDVYNRVARLYLGAWSPSGLVEDPAPMSWQLMQSLNVTDAAEDSIAILNCVTELANFNKPRNVMYTDAQLQEEYSGDLFFEYIEKVADAQTVWGGRGVPLGGQAERGGGGVDEWGQGGEDFG